MSVQYDTYLKNHKDNVAKGYKWFMEKMPHLLMSDDAVNAEWHICMAHDHSKNEPEEYEAYDAYFYGGNRSFGVVERFNRAWLHHIHNNPHHWQYWILINDDPKNGETLLEMPFKYILEMICDWWAFSWQKENLYEIFNWYEERKDYIKLHCKTRKTLESLLSQMKEQLLKDDGGLTQ